MNNPGTLEETQDAEIDKLFEIEVIDIEQIFGVVIDREQNNRTAFNRVENNKLNFRAYVPFMVNLGDKLQMTMKILVKITTPVKLNLVNQSNQVLISQEDADAKEVHYV